MHNKSLIVGAAAAIIGGRNGQSPELAAQLATVFEQATSPAYSYRLTLQGNQLLWTAAKNGKSIEYHEDSETSVWRRLKSTIVGRLAPEEWL